MFIKIFSQNFEMNQLARHCDTLHKQASIDLSPLCDFYQNAAISTRVGLKENTYAVAKYICMLEYTLIDMHNKK